MKKIESLTRILTFLILLIFISSCSKGSESNSLDKKSVDGLASLSEKSEMDLDREPGYMGKGKIKNAKTQSKDIDDRGLETHFLAPMELAEDRLLEYKVNLTYETEDLLETRMLLLGITAKYGFISNSQSTSETKNPYMTTDINVRTESLYEALQEFEQLGKLLTENITVVDHTEQMVLTQRKIKRDRIRINRKNKTIGQVAPGAKTWTDRESSLERSEDRLDNSKHKEWKIQDTVSLAKIHLYLKGPDMPDRIEVPNYWNALVTVIDMFLNIFYALIVIFPIAILIGVIWWKRKKLFSFFYKKE